MKSFKLLWQQPDSQTLYSSWVGPEETAEDSCVDAYLTEEQLALNIIGGAIWYDVFDVQAVQLFLSNAKLLTLGFTSDEQGNNF